MHTHPPCKHDYVCMGGGDGGSCRTVRGADSTSRTACSALYMNELASQVCTGEPVRTIRVRATPEVTS